MRLFAKGFGENNQEQIPKDSSRCYKEVRWTMLTLVAQKQLKLKCYWCKDSILHDGKIERKIFCHVRKEANTAKVWKFKKFIYCWGNASHKWYNRVKIYLLSTGLIMSKANPALFYYHEHNLTGMVVIHVDDFVWSETIGFEVNLISKLHNIFIIGKKNQPIFQYLGINLVENGSEITTDQISYSENLKPINCMSSRTNAKDLLKSQIGKSLWMSKQTRRDIAFDVCQ